MWLCAWNWLDCVSIHTICLCVCGVCVRIQQDPIIMCRVRCIDIPAQNKITFQMNLLTMIPLKCKFAVYPGNSVIRRTTKTIQFRALIHFFYLFGSELVETVKRYHTYGLPIEFIIYASQRGNWSEFYFHPRKRRALKSRNKQIDIVFQYAYTYREPERTVKWQHQGRNLRIFRLSLCIW